MNLAQHRIDLMRELRGRLAEISQENGYSTDFVLSEWQARPAEYETNWLTFRDPRANYSEENQVHRISVELEIEAVVYGSDATGNNPEVPSINTLATLALGDILRCLAGFRSLNRKALILKLTRDYKDIQLAGRPMAQIVQELTAIYQVSNLLTPIDRSY